MLDVNILIILIIFWVKWTILLKHDAKEYEKKNSPLENIIEVQGSTCISHLLESAGYGARGEPSFFSGRAKFF